jgi:hypothetical protein
VRFGTIQAGKKHYNDLSDHFIGSVTPYAHPSTDI